MLRRAAIRLATGAVTLLLVSMLVFGLVQLAPGSPLANADDGLTPLSAEDREALEAYYGFDRPLSAQYASWLARLVRGDLGDSIRDRRPVADKIAERLPVTLTLNALALAQSMSGLHDAAASTLNRAIAIDSESARAWESFASVAVNAGRFEDALVAARRALELDGELPDAWNNLCVAQFNLGRLYMEGRGVEKNKGLGLYWIQNAADGDDKRAVDYLKDYQARR